MTTINTARNIAEEVFGLPVCMGKPLLPIEESEWYVDGVCTHMCAIALYEFTPSGGFIERTDKLPVHAYYTGSWDNCVVLGHKFPAVDEEFDEQGTFALLVNEKTRDYGTNKREDLSCMYIWKN